MAPDEAQPSACIQVEVVFCPAAGQVQRASLRLSTGSTLAQAVQASGLLEAVDPASVLDAGVWGRRRPPGHVLQEGDRVEIYRGLRCDPKQSRRERHRGPRRSR